jgi:hypothetical protein
MSWPEMNFSIEKVTVVAQPRVLEATYVLEWPEREYELDEDWVAEMTREITFNCLNFDWTRWHRATRKERLQILGYK